MALVKRLPVKYLKLDPKNFRHMPQKTEEQALHAMASLKPDYFWALAEQLLRNNYIERENIIVLKSTVDDDHPVVKEGNRRTAILKLGLGLLKGKGLEIPGHICDLLSGIGDDWRKKNAEVPCLVFEPSEEA